MTACTYMAETCYSATSDLCICVVGKINLH